MSKKDLHAFVALFDEFLSNAEKYQESYKGKNVGKHGKNVACAKLVREDEMYLHPRFRSFANLLCVFQS